MTYKLLEFTFGFVNVLRTNCSMVASFILASKFICRTNIALLSFKKVLLGFVVALIIF